MSELLVTQCPYCQTRFRLTPEQLLVAAGNVRCGACLEVFNASEAEVTEAPATSAAEPPAPAPVPAPGSALLHDDLDEPDLQALGLDESIIDEVNPCGMTGHRKTGLEAVPVGPDDDTPADPTSDSVTDAQGRLSSRSVKTDSQATPATESFSDLHEDFLATPPAQDFGPNFDHNRSRIQHLRPMDDDYADHGIFRRDRPTAGEQPTETSAS